MLFIYASILFMMTSRVRTEGDGIPVGHMEPLGGHRPPEVIIDETDTIPDPWTFWEKYVNPGIPLILRGAARESPAFELWTKEYLTENYGDLEIRLEGKDEKDSPIPVGSEGLGRDSISSFFSHYHLMDTYMISELPSPMFRDVTVLSCMSCGNMAGRMVEVDLWVSSGDSKSILHKDAFNQMNCLMNGTKHWKTMDYKYEKYIHRAWEPGREIGGYSSVNVDSVDLLKYPNISKIPWSNFSLNAGDCMFLPKSYYHQVNSQGPMNVAVSILFSRIQSFEDNDCDPANLRNIPLSEIDVLWKWPGHGIMSMGNTDVWSVRQQYVNVAKKMGVFNKGSFINEYVLLWPDKLSEKYEQNLMEAWDVIDPEGKDQLTADELLALDTPTLLNHCLKASPVDPSNTLEFEYFYIDDDDIKELLLSLINEDNCVTKEAFIHNYTTSPDFGGTEKFAMEIWGKLRSANPEAATLDEVITNVDKALENWSSRALIYLAPEADFSGESMLWRDEVETTGAFEELEITKDEL